MSEREIDELLGREADRPLDGLEAGIWAGAAARRDERKKARLVAALQAGVLTVALMASVTAGVVAANAAMGHERSALGMDMQLAPSMLLLGRHS